MITKHTTKLWEDNAEGYSTWLFWCPGCNMLHSYSVGRAWKPNWEFNGNLQSPSFTPSLKYTENNSLPPRGCHLFITNGNIVYCNDSPHNLKGQTIPMVDIPANCFGG